MEVFFKLVNRPIIIYSIFCGLILSLTEVKTFAQAINIKTTNGYIINIGPCSSSIVRVRVRKDIHFEESLMERYEIVKKDWPQLQYKSKEEGNRFVFSTDNLSLEIDRSDGTMIFKDSLGKVLVNKINFSLMDPNREAMDLQQSLSQQFGKDDITGGIIIGDTTNKKKVAKTTKDTLPLSPTLLSFSLNETERFYGLGSASRSHIQHRGHAARIWVQYQKSEAPIPFIMSTNGWGIFNNSTRKHFFDVGKLQKDKMSIYQSEGEELDFYLIAGKNMAKIIEHYTTITGKPYLLPKWCYGLAFGSNTLETQFNVLENAYHFRQEKIPCDIYWLEPQWMKKYYDFSTQKEWDDKKFTADLPWTWPDADTRKTLFIQRLKDMGFKTALWICVNEDLSIEEEDRIAKEEGKPLSGKEPWFPHLTKFVDQGIRGFKIDPARTLDTHPDLKYYNKKTDSEMHLINQVLVVKHLKQMYQSHTGLRSFHHYCGGFAGIQHWGASTTGDNGGRKQNLFDVLNDGISGHMNLSCDIIESVWPIAPGAHMGFFLPWVQLDSWAYVFHPWYFSEKDKSMLRDYAQLRYSLIPYIYSTAINGALTGMPIARAMPLVYPHDSLAQDLETQYMFGESLLVGAFTNKVYLPEGNWIDYWTGKTYKGKQEIICDVPENRGGPLFIKKGSIIPYQLPRQFISERAEDTLIIKVYPEGNSDYTLLEDDGLSYKYEEGKISRTLFQCKQVGSNINFLIKKSEGEYSGIPEKRIYQMEFYTNRPKKIVLNNKALAPGSWKYSLSKKMLSLTVVANNKADANLLLLF